MVAEGRAVEELSVLPWKIDRPRPSPSALRRPRLAAPWELTGARCTLVAAPAGFGKTTLVRQWVDERATSTAWVTADRADADPMHLLCAVVAALDPVVAMPRARRLLGARAPQLAEVMAAVGSALRAAGDEVVVVIDDVHLLREPASLELVDQLVDAVPEGSSVVLVGRTLPPLRWERRRLCGEVLDVGPDDLAFDRREARSVIRRGLGADLPEAVADELFERTEGWPAGLQLCLLALRAQPHPREALEHLVVGGGHLADYVEEELLVGVTDEERSFLLQTSVLERLTGPLCDAVTERPGSSVVLDRLVHAGNLFVVPLEQAGSFRYHHLFGEQLLAALRRTDPALEPELRRRAAEGLLVDGDAEGAVHQALASGDVDHAASVVYRLLFPSLDRGSSAALGRWLAAFPSGAARHQAPLLVVRAWVALNDGRASEVADLLAQLDELGGGGALPDGTVSLDVARAVLHMIGGRAGVKAMRRAAEVVIAAGPGGSPWWGVAQMQRAVAVYLAGEPEDPVEMFDAAERATQGEGVTHAITLAHCGLVRLQRDDLDGYTFVDRAIAELAEHGAEHEPLAAMVFTALSYAEATRGRAEASEAAARRADELVGVLSDAIPRGAAHHRLVLADAALVRRDLPAAARELALAQAALPAEPDAARLHDWADRIARRTSARSRADGESAWSQLSPAELRVLGELGTHRSLEEIGAHLYVSRNTVKSHTIAIYRKLGVSRRSAAVERAVELGLLEG